MKQNYNSQILEKARVLCQDHDIEVRKIMASEVLEQICQVIPLDMFDMDIYEKIIELVYDQEIHVKVLAIDLVFKVADYFNEEMKRTRITSLFLELLYSVNIEVVKVMSTIIGSVLAKLEHSLKKTQNMQTILNIYQ